MSSLFRLYFVGINLLCVSLLVSSSRHHVIRKRTSTVSGELLKECPKETVPRAARDVPTYQFTFDNEVHQALNLHWVGTNSKTVLVLSTTTALTIFGRLHTPSSLWRSVDGGRHYNNITSEIGSDPITADTGVIRSPADPNMIVMVAALVLGKHQSHIYVTRNAGESWSRIDLPFRLVSLIPNSAKANVLLADSAVEGTGGKNGTLYMSVDYGKTWRLVMANVERFFWGPKPDTVFVSVASVGKNKANVLKLLRTDDLFNTYKVVNDELYRFVVEKNFLYASVYETETTRRLYVTRLDHPSMKFQLARLPETQTAGVFYVLDVTDGMSLIHVDTAGKGQGSIFISDSSSTYFTKALDNHVQLGKRSDFYKVLSMRGTFITSVTVPELPTLLGSLVASRISFDNGARWQKLAVDGCKGDAHKCSLHIHGLLSLKVGVIKQLPASDAGAPGLVVAHGNTGIAHSKAVDIYITLDGGYKWKKVLEGPHFYTIADQGKLLLAVPVTANHLADTIYFSENHGECWSKIQFSTTPWHFTGMEADPKALGLKVTLWGYTPKDGLWQTMEVDFSQVIDRECTPGDYDKWKPHSKGGKDGCLLGYKETIDVIKPDVWCAIPDETRNSKVDPCACTLEDLECDYGYVWNSKKTECIVDSSLPADFGLGMLCAPGQTTFNSSVGYRRIPGDKCIGGVADQLVKVTPASCKKHVTIIPNGGDVNANKKHATASIVVVVILALASVVALAYVFYKFILPKKIARYNYRYQALGARDNEEGTNSGLVIEEADDEGDVHLVNA